MCLCASGPVQRAWVGEQHSDSWSNVAPCLTLSTVCSPGWRVAPLYSKDMRRIQNTRWEGAPPWSLGSSYTSTRLWGVLKCALPWILSGSVTLSVPWHPGDPRGSHSKQPADYPFAPSLRSKPRGPVITRQPHQGGHTPTVRSFHRTICAASAVCLSLLTCVQSWFSPLLTQPSVFEKTVRCNLWNSNFNHLHYSHLSFQSVMDCWCERRKCWAGKL